MENKKVYRVKNVGKAFTINGLQADYAEEKFVEICQKSRRGFV